MSDTKTNKPYITPVITLIDIDSTDIVTTSECDNVECTFNMS